jgi:hypothetical protein
MIQLEAQPASTGTFPLKNANLRYHFESEDSVRIFKDVFVTGRSDGRCTVVFSSDSVHQVEGMVTGEGINLALGEEVSLSGLTLRLPFVSKTDFPLMTTR